MNFAWILEWDLEKNISSSGPEVRGCRPVLVTFETFKDRETVFRQTKMLKKGANIDVTEDLSKRTRENRAELRKFMRKVRCHEMISRGICHWPRSTQSVSLLSFR